MDHENLLSRLTKRRVRARVAAGLVCLALVAGARAASTWQRTETEGCVIYSDASNKDITEFAVDFAAYRQVFSALFASLGHQPPSCTLILFRREADFAANTPPSRIPGGRMTHFTIEVDDTPVIALPLSGDRDRALELTFEFETTWALRRIGYYVPIWMAQGAGKVLSSLRLKKGVSYIGEYGDELSEPYLHDRQSIDWEQFFGMSESSPEYLGKKRPGVYHAQAWALMHWILLKDADTRERFETLANKLRSSDPLAAVAEVMAVKPAKFEDEISWHLGKYRNARTFPFDDARMRAALVLKPAPEAEVLSVLSDLQLAADHPTDCRRSLARAKALAPDLPCVKEALARFALHERNDDDAIQLYRESIEAGTTNPQAYLASANARLDGTSAGNVDRMGSGGRGVNLAIGEIRKALALRPGDQHAYALLARAYFLKPQLTPEEAEEVRPGVSNGAWGEYVRYRYAWLLERVKLPERARDELMLVAGDPDTEPPLREHAAREATKLGFDVAVAKAEELVNDEKYAEADQIVAAAEEKETDPEMRANFARFRRHLEELKAGTKESSGR